MLQQKIHSLETQDILVDTITVCHRLQAVVGDMERAEAEGKAASDDVLKCAAEEIAIMQYAILQVTARYELEQPVTKRMNDIIEWIRGSKDTVEDDRDGSAEAD